MPKEKAFMYLISMILFLWMAGFSSARNEDLRGYFMIPVPRWLSKLLFIKKFKNEIMLQTLLYQIWVYVMTIGVLIGYKLRLLGVLSQVVHLYLRLTVGTALVYLIITLPDVIVYSIKDKKKLW